MLIASADRPDQETRNGVSELVPIPRVSTLANRILEQCVLEEAGVSSYNLRFTPLVEDVVSLEDGLVFKEIWVAAHRMELGRR